MKYIKTIINSGAKKQNIADGHVGASTPRSRKTNRRFKPDSQWYVGAFYLANGGLALLSVLVLRIDIYLRFLVLALVGVVLVNLVFAARTRNRLYLFPALNYLLVAVLIWNHVWASTGVWERLRLPLAAAYAANLVVVLALGLKRKLKWRREEVLELAAAPVEGNADGFTGRPFPAGRVDASAEEIAAFSRFLFRHLIAVPYPESERLLLVIPRRPLDHLLKLSRRRDRDTWVAFAADGRLTVNIVRDDYLHYRDEYTFDLLCRSLARLLLEFLELHRNGRGREIIARLDALRLFPFTGALVGF